MGDGSLTQDEIDLLLQGAGDVGAGSAGGLAGLGGTGGGSEELSPLERENVGDIIHSALQSGTQGLGLILSRTVKLGPPYVDVRAQGDVEREFGAGQVLFAQKTSGALNGTLALFIGADAAAKISAIVMGNDSFDSVSADLDSAQIATVKDAMGPMLFSVATQISVRIGSVLTPMPVEVTVLSQGTAFPLREAPSYLRIQIPFTVEGAVDAKINLLMPMPMAQSLSRMARSQEQTSGRAAPTGGMAMPSGPQPGQLGVKEVAFPSLAAGPVPSQANMNLLMDVQMTLTVELGRTKMYIKEILGLGEGSIIELDKLAGEPVDLLVNGKLIAKGEVVVIDENFGVRVTDIVSPIDRLKQGQQ